MKNTLYCKISYYVTKLNQKLNFILKHEVLKTFIKVSLFDFFIKTFSNITNINISLKF